MGNKLIRDNELKLLLEKQESLLKEFLDFSQRQFAQSDAVTLDELLSQKDKCFEDLQKLDSLLEKWHKQYERPLGEVEQILDENIQDLLERILISEREFEKIVGHEKNTVTLQISQLGSQMLYRKDPTHQRPKIKNMTT